MQDRVVLNEEGGLTRSAGEYDYSAEDGGAAASDFLGRVEGTEHGMVGRGGNRARELGGALFGNLNRIAAHITDQATRVRTADAIFVDSDVSAAAANATAQSEAEANRTELNAPIEA